MFSPYEDPEKAHRSTLSTLFQHTDLLERLTKQRPQPASLRKDPEGDLFAWGFHTQAGQPVYVYLRASTFGSPQTEYDQVGAQASFIVRHPEALYYALLLREAWFEWDAVYMERRLDLPFHRIGYEELLEALESIDWAREAADVRSVGQTYYQELRREYESFRVPFTVSDGRLRAYACLLRLKERTLALWAGQALFPLFLDIRTRLHLQSYRLEEHLLIQRPPYRVTVEGHDVGLYWEMGKAGLILKVWLPPMPQKAARALHAQIRKLVQPIVGAHLPLGRTRATLKGIDPYHDRQVNLLRVDAYNPFSLADLYEEARLEAQIQVLAEAFLQALRLLPEMVNVLSA